MSRSVLISATADRELRQSCEWWAKHRSAAEAQRWYDKFMEQLFSLADEAERFALAQESHAFASRVYQLNFGLGARPTHRALYIVRREEVLILRVRHVSQGLLTEHDLFET